jgi:outer membrane protein assembly factor BamA
MAAILLIISLFTFTLGQEAKSVQQIEEMNTQESVVPSYKCSQPATEREALIHEATESQYTNRKLELLGNTYTRDAVLRQRMAVLQEGDVFTREKLLRSLANVSRLNSIYHIKLGDVEIHLDRQEKFVDILVCFKEKRRVYH